MKTRTREIAKPGIYGTIDDPKIVLDKDLREIAETFPDIGRAPISLHGHWPDPRAPRLGNVVAVTFDEASKSLSATIEEHDVLAKLVDDGSYPDVSIGAKRRASDGKMYLHHLAYLGEEPPAIKDLVGGIVKQLESESPGGIAAADSGEIVELPSPKAATLDLSDGERKKLQEERMDAKELQERLELALSDNGRLKADNEKLLGKLTALSVKYPEEVNLSDSDDPRVAVLAKQVRDGRRADLVRAAAGKIPKAKESLVVALADSFSTGEAIELSDGNAKVKKSQFDVLAELFASMPRLVEPGAVDLSDGPASVAGAAGKPATVAFSKA